MGLKRPVAQGQAVARDDVEIVPGDTLRFRREMEAVFAAPARRGA